MDENSDRNKKLWGEYFSAYSPDMLVQDVKNADAFLNEMTQFEVGWAGFYRDNFRDRLRGARILELGAGDGKNALLMVALGAEKVTAIEITNETERLIISAADELGFTERIEVRIGDFAVMDFEERSFDFVVGKALLHHLTHEVEDQYLQKVAKLLRLDGEARFFEPAINSQLLDQIRWIMPVRGRPSRLNKQAFAAWKAHDSHPERDNSTEHYRAVASRYFAQVEIKPIGGLERFHRILPGGNIQRHYREAALKAEHLLPMGIQSFIARSQTIILHQPK